MKKTTFLFFVFAVINYVNAQSLSSYQFLESSEIYQPLQNANISTAEGDDGSENNIPIGFSFWFANVNYSTFSISTNGWIRLGQEIPGNSYTNNLSNANTFSPLIAPFFDDHNAGSGIISYQVSGLAPNRFLEVDWNNISLSTATGVSTTDLGSFKLRLYETTNQISFIYGSLISLNSTASIGINSTDSFLSVSPAEITTLSSISANNEVQVSSFLPNRKYTFVPPAPCSGIPDAGNAISSASTTCASNQITITLENEFNISGYSFQWQKSVNGTEFTNIPNATSPVLQAFIDSNTYFRCLVSCGLNSDLSTPILVNLSAVGDCFCDPFYSTGKTFGDLISNVLIGGTTLSNNTGTDPVNPYYTYFTGLPNYTATLQAGFSYPITISVGTYEDQNVSIWIDYNDDTIFATDERIGYTQTEIGANGTSTFNISLDCEAPAGLHRMRIRDVYQTDAFDITPCGNFQYGETEDYDITISASTQCQIPLQLSVGNSTPTSAELLWLSGCGQVAWDVNVAIEGSGLPVGTPSHPNVTSGVIISSLLPSTNYEFYVRAICEENGLSEWAGPFVFTTAPVAVANDDCENSLVLTIGSSFVENQVLVTNAGSTKSLGQPNPTCGIFGFGGDIWFSVIVPSSGNITIETQAAPNSNLQDTVLSAYTGTCGSLTTINCNDDIGPTAFSQLNLTGLQPGSTIYARVWEYANDVTGDFYVSAFNPTLKNESFDASNFNYYPNPVTDFINISYKEVINNVSVYNLAGQHLLTKKIGENQGKINLSDLPEGVYVLKINSGSETQILKVIKN